MKKMINGSIINVRVPRELRQMLENVALRRRTDVSEIVREALWEYHDKENNRPESVSR